MVYLAEEPGYSCHCKAILQCAGINPLLVKRGSDVSAEMGRRLKVAVGSQERGRGGLGQSGSIKAGTKKKLSCVPTVAFGLDQV
jgi:hypothetical protein